MTREEAIQALNEIFDDSEFSRYEAWYGTAMNMAIEALQQDPVTYTFDVKSDKCEECAFKRIVEELTDSFENYIVFGERREP